MAVNETLLGGQWMIPFCNNSERDPFRMTVVCHWQRYFKITVNETIFIVNDSYNDRDQILGSNYHRVFKIL